MSLHLMVEVFLKVTYSSIRNRANYHVAIRDSYISNSEGAAISVESFHPKAYVSQLIRITNSVIDKSTAGIRIHYYNSPDINITAIPQIVIEDCIIMNIRRAFDDWKSGSTSCISEYTVLNVQFMIHIM